jgi:hypothetical protein
LRLRDCVQRVQTFQSLVQPRAVYAQHLSQIILCDDNVRIVAIVDNLQQPSAQAGLQLMRKIARRYLLASLRNPVVVLMDQIAKSFRPIHHFYERFERETKRNSAGYHDGAGKRRPLGSTADGADRAFRAEYPASTTAPLGTTTSSDTWLSIGK